MSLSILPYLIIALVVAISVHEAAHAYVANYLGDPTAKLQGRVSLNPLRHLDPLGTICIFIAGFGWGKPVPVNPYNLKNPLKDQALISLAGPLSNLATAALLAIPVKYFADTLPEVVLTLLVVTIELNIVLMVFNLLPIAPLDGSKVLYAILPRSMHNGIYWIEKNGPLILLLIILIDRSSSVSILGTILGPMIDGVKALIFFST